MTLMISIKCLASTSAPGVFELGKPSRDRHFLARLSAKNAAWKRLQFIV